MSLWENLTHLGLGVVLVVGVGNAYLGRIETVVAAFLLFAILGGVDEYVFHRGLPEIESDVHAKEHLALFIFVIVFAALELLGAGHPVPGGLGGSR